VLVGAAEWPDDAEVWVTAQSTGPLFIVRGGNSPVETVKLPSNAGPHITTFSPSRKFAYVAGMGNGDLFVIRAEDRQVVQTLKLGHGGTHQARPSPDGSVLLVAQAHSSSLVKVAVDEKAASWTVSGNLVSFAAMAKRPICTVFRDDGGRAYVSLLPNGLAIVDVPRMTVLNVLSTDGFVACGMVKSRDGKTVIVAASGGGGHFYRLDTASDTLTDAGTVGAADWHSLALSEDEQTGFATSPGSDELQVIDLREPVVRKLPPIVLDPTPGTGNDQPDAMAVKGKTVFVTLRASGKLAIVDVERRTVTYRDLAAPVPPGVKIPMTCDTCALHGVTVRP
ncbi:MAG: YncE family protein, partial [Candidatus Rokuibacteriota bacterium]